MADTTTGLPSLTSRVLDARGKWTKEWAPWIKRLLDTVKSTSTALETVTVDVDQINSSYTISTNVNGRITGAIKLDGSGATSTFAVLADKFVIVLPSNDATTITAFVAGLVNGIATVGINGNLLVDGTLLARSIAANTITANKIAAGTITANELAADSVTATQIAAGAITANDITTGTLTAVLIQSTSGNSYWNLATGDLQLGA